MSLLTRNLDLFDPLDAEIAEKSTRAEQLEAVAAHVRRCLRCDLHETRTQGVPGEGSPQAKLMIVGEGPGETEDAMGRPFVGRAGELLDRILEAASLSREEIFITNVVKSRDADLVGGKLQNRAPLTWEIEACRPYLVRQVEIIQPRVILCLGASAAKGVINRNFNLTEQRGQWFPGPFDAKIMATFHPAFILRRGGAGAGAKELKKLVWEDMKKVIKRLA